VVSIAPDSSTHFPCNDFDIHTCCIRPRNRVNQTPSTLVMAKRSSNPFKTWLAPRKLLFYGLFYGFHWGLFVLGWWLQATDEKLAGLNTLTFSVWFSRGAGLVLSVDVTMILLPMCRSIITALRPKVPWLHLDESSWFHRQVAYAMLLFTCIHVGAHYVK